MTTYSDLEAVLAALPQPDLREVLADLAEARRAEPAEPGIIPLPEHVFPPGRHWSAPILAFGCPHRCGWAHHVDPLVDVLEDRPLTIPVGSPEDMTAAISAHAQARSEVQRQQIEAAILEHLRTAHSDQEDVRTLEESSPSSPPTASRCAAPPSSPPMAGPLYARGES